MTKKTITSKQSGNPMKLGTRDINTLHDIHDSLNGTSTLLAALTRYDGVDPDVKSAIDIIADILETDRAELQHLLDKNAESRLTGHVKDGEHVAKQ